MTCHSSFPTLIDLTPFRNASFDIP
jgi:hypothetical protein